MKHVDKIAQGVVLRQYMSSNILKTSYTADAGGLVLEVGGEKSLETLQKCFVKYCRYSNIDVDMQRSILYLMKPEGGKKFEVAHQGPQLDRQHEKTSSALGSEMRSGPGDKTFWSSISSSENG